MERISAKQLTSQLASSLALLVGCTLLCFFEMLSHFFVGVIGIGAFILCCLRLVVRWRSGTETSGVPKDLEQCLGRSSPLPAAELKQLQHV